MTFWIITFWTTHSRPKWPAMLAIWTLAVTFAPLSARAATVEELKERVANAGIAERPSLCIEISERRLDEADRLYVAGDSEKAKATMGDVTAFAELARDYAIQSHKHEKQSEIAIRKMTRKLANLKHTVAHEDQQPIQDVIDHLQRIRDDLLAAMFPHGVKK
jgi:hypothetical protein